MIVGVMDSGIGGLTTLGELNKKCGGEFVFVSDRCGPYGDKDDAFVLDRTFLACKKLKALGARLIVIACNTATNVAIKKLREFDPETEYIGVEPAVKPALENCKSVAVALTPTAARQEKFLGLLGDNQVRLVTIPSLAPDIERYYYDEKKMSSLALSLCDKCCGCDGLVLGCTHYIYLKSYLRQIDPTLKIYDGNGGVAKRLYEFVGWRGETSIRFETIR